MKSEYENVYSYKVKGYKSMIYSYISFGYFNITSNAIPLST